MITWLQKYHHTVLVFVLVITILGMVWLFNPASDIDAMRSGSMNRVATIYGRTVDIEAYRKSLRLLSLAAELGMREYIEAMSRDGGVRMPQEDQFIYNTMILRREAERLQLNPTEEEMVQALKEVPYFQGEDGRFDSGKLATFMQDSLASRGFTQSQLDDIIRDSLRVKKLQAMIGGAVPAPEAEARRYYDLSNQRMLVQAAKLKTEDFAREINPTEEEITKHFELNEATYMTDEQRRVEYVVFKTAPLAGVPTETETGADPAKPAPELTDEQKRNKVKLQGDAAQKATDFGTAVAADTSKDAFKTKAAAEGLEVKSTELYNTDGFNKDLRTLGTAAFRAAQQLTAAAPVSDALPVGDDFAVLYLAELKPAERMTLEQARPTVIAQVKEKMGEEKMNARAEELRDVFLKGLAEGKSFEEIAKAEQKVTLLTPPPFRPMDPPREAENIGKLIDEAIYMKPGTVSQKVEIADGVMLVHVKQREAANADGWEVEKESTLSGIQESLRRQFLYNWFAANRKEAELTTYDAASATAKRG